MSLKKLFEPTHQKLVISIVISVLISIVFKILIPSDLLVLTIIYFFLSIIVYYPLACGIICIYKHFKEHKQETLDIVVSILLILLWNPIAPIIIPLGTGIVGSNVLTYPCGVKIMGFAENSPARDAGIRIGEIVMFADGIEIRNLKQFSQVTADKKPGERVILTTKNSEYDIALIEDANTQKAIMGIMIADARCAR